MKKHAVKLMGIAFVILLFSFFSATSHYPVHYTQFSRFTDPGPYGFMYDSIPGKIEDICKLSQMQLQHHLLLYYQNAGEFKPANEWSAQVQDILHFLHKKPPFRLDSSRQPVNRFVGKCTSESYFLASMLRHQHIPVRIRTGFLSNIREDKKCIHRFWNKISLTKASLYDMGQAETDQWQKINHAITCWQNNNDHCIEHWICEYWDRTEGCWRLLDANTDFLKYHSNLQVDILLPDKYFDYAWEVWKEMRQCTDFEGDKYTEELQGGKSHIRSLLLWDFYNLLNHDLAGIDEKGRLYNFINIRCYQQLSYNELKELDALAVLLSEQPSVKELIHFYKNSETLQFPEVTTDPYCFIAKQQWW